MLTTPTQYEADRDALARAFAAWLAARGEDSAHPVRPVEFQGVEDGHGDLADVRASNHHLNTLCAEHGVDPDEAFDAFA